MVRPAIGTLIVVAALEASALAIGAPAGAELPMSPVFRTDQTTLPGKATEPVKPDGSQKPEAAAAAAPKRAGPSPAAKVHEAKPGDAKVVATALIPPPPSPASLPSPPAAPAEAAAAPNQAAAEHAAIRPRPRRHEARPHYAYSRYPYLYRYYSAWSASGPPHIGPNPYSPNGGD